MMNIQLELSIDDTNQILNVLAQQPYVKVSEIIDSIKTQAQAQIQAEELSESTKK